MFHLKDGQSPKLHHWTLSEMVFYFLFLLLLPHCCKGIPQVIGPTQPLLAYVGDDVILPCHLKPSMDVAAQTVEWSRPDLKPRFVHLWRSGEELLNNQNPSYVGRTSLFISELKNGNVSLKLSRVKLSDRGTYRCFIPTLNKDATVELLFGSVSSPGVNISKVSDGVSLDCRSEGWFPQPELVWLDGERRVLPAGPTETLRGPDGLFTVSSRLTVEKTNRDSFTCRVHQENINQTRETHIQVSDDFFETCSSCVVYVSIMGVILLGVLAAAAFVFWKWRKIQTKDRKPQQPEAERKEREKLIADGQKIEDLEEKKKTLEEELKKKEREEQDLKWKVHKLLEQSKGVHKLRVQKEEMERITEGIEERFQSAEKMSVSDRAQGFSAMKMVATITKRHLKKRTEELYNETRLLQVRTDDFMDMMKDRQGAVESNKREICEQLEEIQRKLSELKEKNDP